MKAKLIESKKDGMKLDLAIFLYSNKHREIAREDWKLIHKYHPNLNVREEASCHIRLRRNKCHRLQDFHS